jgi:hypothetical protein
MASQSSPSSGHRAVSAEGRPAIATCCAAALALTLTACQSETFRTVDLTPPARITEAIPEEQLLDVGIAVFDGNVPRDYDAVQLLLVNPEVRRAESYYMPYTLKTVLESTGNWGAVRMVPDRTHAVDLLVTGKIVASQGERLVLNVQARDARGTLWFDKTYEALASKYAYGDALPPSADPFQHTYTRIADDLAAYFVELTAADRSRIRRTAEMQFARDLLPAAYEDYVERTPSGQIQVTRLPARDDPMMSKVRRVREREFLFIDTLDLHYAEYLRRIRPLYQSWRRAAYTESMEQLELRQKRRRKIVVGTVSVLGGLVGGPATFAGISTGAEMLRDSFGQKNEAEMRAEALREVSTAMESEVMPHTLELENKSVELTGTVQEQYAKLRQILKRTYFESLGLPAVATAAGSAPDGEPAETSQSTRDPASMRLEADASEAQ